MMMPNQRYDETGKIWDFFGSLGKQADRSREPETLCFMRIISTNVLQVSHSLRHVRVWGLSGQSPLEAEKSKSCRLLRSVPASATRPNFRRSISPGLSSKPVSASSRFYGLNTGANFRTLNMDHLAWAIPVPCCCFFSGLLAPGEASPS